MSAPFDEIFERLEKLESRNDLRSDLVQLCAGVLQCSKAANDPVSVVRQARMILEEIQKNPARF